MWFKIFEIFLFILWLEKSILIFINFQVDAKVYPSLKSTVILPLN